MMPLRFLWMFHDAPVAQQPKQVAAAAAIVQHRHGHGSPSLHCSESLRLLLIMQNLPRRMLQVAPP